MRLWDLTGRQLALLHSGKATLHSAQFAPSGDRVVVASQDGSASILNLWGEKLAAFRFGHGPPLSVLVSPSGDRILTTSENGLAFLWNFEGEELAMFRNRNDHVEFASFSPSGNRVLTAFPQSAALWLVRPEDIRQLADERITREFTAEEREKYASLFAERITPK